jgi:hypothetical protein
MNVIAAFALLTAVLSFGEAWGDVPPAQGDAKSSPIDLVNRMPKGKLHNPYKDTDTNIVSQGETLFSTSKSSIRISKIPRPSTGRPPSGCSICCCESDISKSEGHRLKGDFSDGSKSHTQECADCDRKCLRGSSTRAARCSRLARDNPSRNRVARRRD